MKRLLLLIIFCIVTSFSFSQTWKNDPYHSRIGFTVTHIMINDIVGHFDTFTVSVVASKKDFSDAQVTLLINAGSINTNVRPRDEDLKSKNYFDVGQYPTIAFKSKEIKKTGTNTYKLTGDITMHGITRTITVQMFYKGTVTNPHTKKITAGIRVKAQLKRTDFKIGISTPFDDIGDMVEIKADGEFYQQ